MRDHSTTARRRCARKPHTCGADFTPIKVGDVYLESVEFPGGDSGHATAAGCPVRMPVCAPCANRNGEVDLLDPIPYEQLCRQGLL